MGLIIKAIENHNIYRIEGAGEVKYIDVGRSMLSISDERVHNKISTIYRGREKSARTIVRSYKRQVPGKTESEVDVVRWRQLAEASEAIGN